MMKEEAFQTVDEFNVEYQAVEYQAPPLARGEVAYLVRDLLASVGEDPEREGLKRTPERVSRMLEELLEGYRVDLTTLVNGAVFESETTGMVVVQNIDFYSLCEHHLLPFTGRAHVAYLPDGKIIGLSKIPRLVDMFARRLQVQERLTRQIGEALDSIIHPKGIAVAVEGTHMCSVMRGVKKANTRMSTLEMWGAFREDESLKREFREVVRNGYN
jgi:GTP cyclohydrolase I